MILDAAAAQALDEWGVIHHAVEQGASDIHLASNSPPMIRVHGQLLNVDAPTMSADDVNHIVKLMTDNYLKSIFYGDSRDDLDYTVEIKSLNRRLRLNIFRQHNGPSIVVRILSNAITTFEQLGLPKGFEKLAMEKYGLVLVTGGTGSGKSTTLNSMIEQINRRQQRHIITIEDPIEVIFENKKALIEQREIGTHTSSFSSAVRSALREAPDVILVGEIRDSDTAGITLKAAQMGALVMATLHTRSAQETITRYLSMFEDNWRGGARQQLADVLRGVMCQILVPTKTGGGRVCASEVMIGSMAVKHLIRDERTHLLASVMEISSTEGMNTMEQSLIKLFNEGKVDLQEAYEHANEKTAFMAQLEPELQKSLRIEWETEVELKNLEKMKETRLKQLATRVL